MTTENGLTRLLRNWHAPSMPLSLHRRITNSFYDHIYLLGLASPRNTSKQTEVLMKRCNACEEEFADKFSFCPVDGSPLNSLAAALVGKESPGVYREIVIKSKPTKPEFHLTIINTGSLCCRLSVEVSFVLDQVHEAWPEFKRDPFGVGRRALTALYLRLRALLFQPNVMAGAVTAVLVLFSAISGLILFGNTHRRPPIDQTGETVEIFSVNFPASLPVPEGSGIGVNSNGRVGLNQGKGEGSAPEPKSSRGGGGSGNHDRLPPESGKVPTTSDIPAPISPPPLNPSLPVAGVDLDPALWRNLPGKTYGEPWTKSTAASKGPGNGGLVGTGDGFGVGPGTGNGVGPGSDGNMGGGKNEPGCCGSGGARGNFPEPNRVYRVPEVTQRAKVLSKPEPQYTELARKNQVTGSVLLSAIFTESGEVASIRALKTLPDGLTEKAIAAARLIRFVPAMRNGHSVSVYMQLEYNFNLY